MLSKYHSDSLRYYMSASITYGADINFSEASLISMHNSELADILGNLVHRVLNLAVKYCNSVIPDTVHLPELRLPFDMSELINGVDVDLASYSVNTAIFRAMECVRATNRYILA